MLSHYFPDLPPKKIKFKLTLVKLRLGNRMQKIEIYINCLV